MIVPLMANADNDFFITEPIPEPEPEPPTVYLLRDEFTTADAAPVASPRTAEPGPGTLVFVDTNNIMSIASGQLAINGTSAVGDRVHGSAVISRQAGNAFFVRLPDMTNMGAGGGSSRVGFGVSATDAALSIGCDYGSGFFRIKDGVVAFGALSTTAQTENHLAFIMRATGGYLLRRTTGAGTYTLEWVYASGTSDAYAKVFFNFAEARNFKVDGFRVLNLGTYDARFATDYGIATDRKAGAVAAGTTFTHAANCIIEFTVTTLPSADNVDVFFRVQDASNYWRCRVTSAGNITLDEVVAGVATNRSSAAAVVANGHRVVIVPDETTIRGFSNNTLRWTYNSASSFQSATSGELDALGTSGVVSDLISWPRTVTLPNV